MAENKKENGAKKKRVIRRKRKGVVDHAMTARWIQEQLLVELPELPLMSERLIERILKLEHKRYIAMGHTRVTFVGE